MQSPSVAVRRQLLSGILVVFGVAPGFAEEPQVHTNRSSPVTLPLPKGDDVFHFVVFGDRTGGPAEGIKVLAQAVEDTNLLDPDLVMTVGDLVNGYNQTPQWMTQMKEFRETMAELKMPWFPVAGNHDIYWRRDPNNPEAKPPREHEDNYEKHFGPLWYWFAHKQCGFLVLFTDEVPADGRPASFSDPSQQRLSPDQMQWLAKSLEEMKPLKHVFVFLHHPYWWKDRYAGSNWDEVHKLLAKNGNVRAVLAGHVHRMSYSGKRDGIDYFALATTGGGVAEHMGRYFGFLHHFNVVTVRDDGYTMAAIPVGEVFDPRQFDALRKKDGDLVLELHHRGASPPIEVAADGSATSIYRLSIENPTSLPLEVTILGDGRKQWTVVPDHRHSTVQPGARGEYEFACVRKAALLEGFAAPQFEMTFDVLAPNLRITMPPRRLEAVTRIAPPESVRSDPASDGQISFSSNGDHLRIDPALFAAPDGPFTLEAWVKPSDRGGAVASNRRFSTGFGLEVMDTPGFFVHAGGEVSAAKASEPLPHGKWSHLAGVYDGTRVALYVNGRQVATAPAAGKPDPSADPLYIGAMPRDGWSRYNLPVPSAQWQGSIDDVRLSRGARYSSEFTPAAPLEADEATVFHLPCDARLGNFTPARGARDFLVPLAGKPALLHESRRE